MQQPVWYEPLRSIRSLGSQKEKIQNMGQLAEARKRHLGQFFTPDAIAAFMWSFVADLPIRDILDNSIGSGRLLQYADPQKHRLYGVDIHAETVDQVKAVVEAAGFECDIRCAGMQDIQPRNFDCSLINPPFSVHLESAHLQRNEGFTRMGKFGPDTSATSDEYAVVQALRASGVVIALLPRSSADDIRSGKECWSVSVVTHRLRAVIDLPPETFKEENANVLTSVVVFGHMAMKPECLHITLDDLQSETPDLMLAQAVEEWRSNKHGKASLNYQHLDYAEPTITLPVTGDNSVTISLDGRRIKLRYRCGFTEARVANTVLKKRITSTELTRLPKGVRYAGQGKLDVEVYLLQDDPIAAFDAFVDSIAKAGGTPVLRPGVRETIRKKAVRYKRAAIPLKHTIWSRGASTAKVVTGHARKTHNVDPSKWVSPVIKQGEAISFTKQTSGKFRFEKTGKMYELGADEVESRFQLQGVSEGWQVVHAGLLDAYPNEVKSLRKRIVDLGIDKWLSWDFQTDDLIEVILKPKGAVAAWEQACGKSRLAAALILLSGVRHGLIVVESRLVDEMLGQLAKINIDLSTVNVIDGPEKLNQLAQINIIAYERLRMVIDPAHSKRITYAHKLRRRIGLLVADEGERLANMDSDQCKALFQVSARKCYIMTGTPIANYPRDIQGLMVYVAGDGTAVQPYGFRRGYIEKNWINSMEYATRGLDAVRNNFVVLEWVSWEFAETLRDGAKREIPKIANVEKYREWLAPHVKRRLTCEPEVAKFIQLPKLEFETIDLDWDADHLAFYLKAADEFAHWYKQRKEEGKNNLAVLLAKLQAVQTALNAPQKGVANLPDFVGTTSKQRAVLQFLLKVAGEGKKALLYCENPSTVTLLHSLLKEQGVDSVPFHGGISIKKRVAAKDEKFVKGTTPIMLATKGTARAGYNLPGSDIVAFYDRSWSSKTEGQAMRRPLRTERKKPVRVVYFHLPGSLDMYQAQMVAFKSDSANAGLDYATPELDDTEFLHLSTILNSFVEDLAKVRNIPSHKMRDLLKQTKASVALEAA